jgi:glycosyltransferase involved in cell wall biosynthesis
MNKRHRLLLTISEFTYSSQVRNLVDLVSLLDREIFDIEIGGLQVNDDAVTEIEQLGVPYYQFRLQPTRPVRLSDAAVTLASCQKLLTRSYDLVHSLLYQSIFTEALLVRRLGRAPYVYTKSNLEWDNHPGQWRRKSQLASAIISISQATSDLLEEKGFGDRSEKIYLGIDTSEFQADTTKRQALRGEHEVPQDAFVFGCAAQFVEWKEHLTVVRAFERIADQHSDVYLLFCGPNHRDAYYDECLEYIDASRHRDRIRLLGTLKDMAAFYSAIDCFTLASRYETFGYVYVEAMSCSRPVIACRAGGPLEIVEEDRTGYFTKMSDPEDLSRQMNRYATDRNQATVHGDAARERVKRIFSKQAMAEKCQNLYLRPIEQGRRSPAGRL